MKIKITGKSARLLNDGEIIRPGVEYDLDETVAAKLIADGHAVAVESAPEETPVAEVETEPVQPTRRRK